ncbi:uncharacterized protein [Argopecten irradians]|uniref:uncharacterized protein n=1 Tax=Argopecten irradians TaxID=31199 RepID=UPI003714F0D6
MVYPGFSMASDVPVDFAVYMILIVAGLLILICLVGLSCKLSSVIKNKRSKCCCGEELENLIESEITECQDSRPQREGAYRYADATIYAPPPDALAVSPDTLGPPSYCNTAFDLSLPDEDPPTYYDAVTKNLQMSE